MLRWLKVTSVALVVLSVVLVAGVRAVCAIVVAQQAEPAFERMRADADTYWPRVQADLTAMKADPFFTRPREGGDAGERLQKLLRWKGAGMEDAPPPEHELTFPPELAAKVTPFELDDEPSLPTAEELAALDFTWLRDLEGYAYWELTTHPHFEGGGPVDGVKMPMPDFMTLLTGAKLRLLDGWRRGDLASARAEVRHVAWLMATTETVLGGMCAAAMLGIEEKARATFTPDEPAAVPTRQAFKRVAWALRSLTHETLPSETRARTYAAARGNVALCVTLGEMALAEPFSRPLLEAYYRDAYEERDAIVSAPPAPCRLQTASRTRALWALDSATMDDSSRLLFESVRADGVADRIVDVLFLRPVRHTMGLLLVSIAVPDGYRHYRSAAVP